MKTKRFTALALCVALLVGGMPARAFTITDVETFIEADDLYTETDTYEYKWDFEKKGSRTWSGSVSGVVSYDDGCMIFDADGRKAVYASHEALQLDTRDFRYFVFDVKDADIGSTLYVEYETTVDAEVASFTVPLDGMGVYVVDMAENAAWTGDYINCRLYSDGKVLFDAIKLTSDGYGADGVTLTYDANTTDAVTGMPIEKTVLPGTAVQPSVEKPSRSGYTFLGWSDAPDSMLLVESAVNMDASKTLYAVWDKNDHWEFASWVNEHDPQNMQSFDYIDGVLHFTANGTAVIQNTKRLGYATASTSGTVEIRLKWNVTDASALKLYVLYLTDSYGSWSNNTGSSLDLSGYGNAPEDFITLRLDLTQNSRFNNTHLNNIRFQFTGVTGSVDVDYVRFTDAMSYTILNSGTKKDITSESVGYIAKSGTTLTPHGETLVNALYTAGELDLSDGYIVAKHGGDAPNADCKVYKLDFAAENITEVDEMFIDGKKAAMLDGAVYIVPNDADITFKKKPNDTGVTLSIGGETHIAIDGKTRQYTAVFDGRISDKTVTWSVNRPDVAVIDENGVLTVLSEGSARITAVSAYNDAIRATLDVDIAYDTVDIVVSGKTDVIIDGTKPRYKATVSGTASNKKYYWTVSDESVAVIDSESGDLTPKKAGKVTVYAVSKYREEIRGSLDVTLSYIPFTMYIDGADTIAKAERSASYRLVFSTDIPDRTATWSVNNEKIAVIDKDTGRLSPMLDGEVILTAVSNYNPDVRATYRVSLNNQPGEQTLTYLSGTQDEVTNLPEPYHGRGAVTLSKQEPKREGYYFIGWAASDDTLDTITEVELNRDVCVYALWGKGVSFDFNGDINGIQTVAGGSVQLSDTYLICRTSETSGEIRLQTKLLNIDPDIYKRVQIRMSTDRQDRLGMYYQTLFHDSKGNEIIRGYESDGFKYAEEFALSRNHQNEGLDNFFTIDVSPYSIRFGDSQGSWSGGSADLIRYLWLDVTHKPNTTVYIDYIRFPDTRRTVHFDANTEDAVSGMPEDMTAAQGTRVSVKKKPKRSGYTFAGWSKIADGSGETYEYLTLVDDVTLYAVWQKSSDAEVVKTEDGGTHIVFDALDKADGEALLVETTAKKGTAFTVTVSDVPGELTVIANAKGYIVIPLDGAESSPLSVEIGCASAVSVRSAKQYADEKSAEMAANAVPVKEPEHDDEYMALWYATYGGLDTTVTTIESVYDYYDPKAKQQTTDDGEPIFVITDPVAYAAGEGTLILNFDNAAEAGLFGAYRNAKPISLDSSVASFAITAPTEKDSASASITTTSLTVNADTHPYLIFKARGTGLENTNLTVDFVPYDGAFSADHRVSQLIDSAYGMMIFDMSECDAWQGTIEKMRFAFDENAAGTFEIDWLMLTDTIPESMSEIVGCAEVYDEQQDGDFPFVDVPEEAWYRADVEKAWHVGFVKGRSETEYVPEGEVTVAEAMALAVRAARIFNGEEEIVPSENEPWYQPYILPAVRGKIITLNEYDDFNVPAKRRDVARMLANALPKKQYTVINLFDSIPGLDMNDPDASAVLKLYRAGIVVGRGENNEFDPDTPVTRAEIAAILRRLAFEDARIHIVTAEEIASNAKRFDAAAIAPTCVLEGCESPRFVNVDDIAIAKSVGVDPHVLLTSLIGSYDAAYYGTVRIGIRADTPLDSGSLYFRTADGYFSNDHRVDALIGETDENGFTEVVFDLAVCEGYVGQIAELRYDPFDKAGAAFELMYIAFEA